MTPQSPRLSAGSFMTPSRPSGPTCAATGSFGSDHRLYAHMVQFYLNDDFLLSVLCDFVVGAVRSGNAAVVVATAAHRHGLAQRLTARGIDVPALLRHGVYSVLDAHDTLLDFIVRGHPNFFRFQRLLGPVLAAAQQACSAPNLHVMVFGETVSLLCPKCDPEIALALERFWEILARSFSFSLLCAYPIQQFTVAGSEQSFLRICAQHSTVIPPDSYPTRESENRIMSATASSWAGS